jgi:hypothetical protein
VPHYAAFVDSIVGGNYPWQVWSYPPTILLYAWPFHVMPYLPGLALFTGLSLTVFVAALTRWRRDGTFLVAATLSPAAVFGLLSGQFHLLIAAALFTAFRLIDRRPLLAGLLIGLLSVKPQVGLFLPVLLLASGRFRVFGAAALTTLALVGLTAVIWGLDIWRAYIDTGIGSQMLVLRDPLLQSGPFMPTLFVNLRFAGLGFDAAMAIQGVITLLVAVVVAWAFWRRKRPLTPADIALFFALSLVGSAYLNAYDTTPLAIAAVLLIADGVDSRLRLALLLVYLLPPIQIVLGFMQLPGSILIPAGLVVLLMLRRNAPTDAATLSPSPAAAASPPP